MSFFKLTYGHAIVGFTAIVFAGTFASDSALTMAVSVMLVPLVGAAIDFVEEKAGVKEEKESFANNDPIVSQ